MGPLRGRLILGLALALMANPALAGVCAELRPGWDAGLGAVTALQETGRLLSSFPGLVALASLAFGLWRPHLWISAACAVPALAMAGLLINANRAETALAARAEGCIGSYWPAAVVLVILAGVTVVRGWQRG